VPFLLAGLVIAHLSLLHLDGSSTEDDEGVEFYYFYFIKDLFAFLLLSIVFAKLVFNKPNYLAHPDNYIPASISVTPAHLVPEWYFLPFYAVLRATPDKFGGFVLMFLVLADLFLFDIIMDDKTGIDLNDDAGAVDYYDDAEHDIEEDLDAGLFFIYLFLGGRDIEEPYTDLSSGLTLLQFLDLFDVRLEEEEGHE